MPGAQPFGLNRLLHRVRNLPTFAMALLREPAVMTDSRYGTLTLTTPL